MDADFASIVERPSLSAIVEHLPCVVYVARPTWPLKLDFISANIERFIGYTAEEVLADPGLLFRCMHPADRARSLEQARQGMERPEPYRMEFRAVHRNGADVYDAAFLSVPVFGPDGELALREGIVVDISEQKRLERELLQSQRLAAIGEMAAMMAHEIRNPLTGMSLALRSLRGVVGSDPEGAECLDDLERCLRRIDETVSRALDFSLERPLAPRPCRLADIVSAACALTATYVRRRRVTLDVSLPPDLPGLTADAAQLEQVFVNLLLNACKAMPDGGRLAIRAWAEPGRLFAQVSDTGVGIASEHLDRIFHPFYSGFGEGSGLGLPLCRRILAAHGGLVHAESTPGKGSTFRIELPLEPGHAARARC